ncbi:glycosyltransferase [Lacisediminihabitans changchengi]|uniref:D-inositol 3-phosphate glycosyltransferase n=1 Tax=Lacisediminihabitans changchengi TaxID=2787634 RepID=A0A934W2R0_9MICO|nr:glycosyltransferase [Lacisediminihabitans changchengi]MBK4346444.1 glycosyltransferase [Lacisediminihabitans changchengi]MBK4348928.1 glycosyltransferase [Lacisediminihabitans changchengi]
MVGLIAHEWIEARGGSENVLEAIAALYPDADLVTPWSNAPHRFPDRNVRELWLADSPLRGRKAASVPFLTAAWRSAIPSNKEYDWVLASSHLFSHHIRPRGLNADAPKLIYAYTPARYIWNREMDERGNGLIAKAGSVVLRPLDRKRAQEATAVAGISNFVRDRISFNWHRDATVIYPPVETTALQSVADWRTHLGGDELAILDSLPADFVLGASRFIPYKRLDLVIASGEEVGMPVVLAGGGPERPRLVAQGAEASVPVTFVDDPSSALLYAIYQRASVFVFPPLEDFGIMPVEAMALGTPVVANAIGGSAETVDAGVSGVHFEALVKEDVGRAIGQALALDPDDCRRWSGKFSREAFDASFTEWMNNSL